MVTTQPLAPVIQASFTDMILAVGDRFANLWVIGYCWPMFVPTKHRFRVKEYYRMAQTGVLRPKARVEPLNGGLSRAALHRLRSQTTLPAGDTAAPLAFPDAAADVAELPNK